ncbi:glycosyltransferase [Microbulbifer sediminum]|uniref:glycosyltransferase n=1 Tax=Microbulbifer sediminum TaxID=2904250 RepID=UPI001F2F07AB|nr:glycosyltransferase [Microbulbifer sediminum]
MTSKEPNLRKALREVKIFTYRAARFTYRKLNEKYGIDALSLKVPFTNKTLKAIVYPIIRGNTVRYSDVGPSVAKICKRKPGESILLARIIGNDIPGIQDENEGLNSLEYILKNEGELPGVRKLFVINRVVSRHKREKLVHLLRQYNASYLEITFKPQEYKKIPLTGSSAPPQKDHSLTAASAINGIVRNVAVRADRASYLLNNLGAAKFVFNCAIKCGYKWVLPWDGNCILSSEQYTQVKRNIDSCDKKARYFLVPVASLSKTSSMVQPSLSSDNPGKDQLVVKVSSSYTIDPRELFKGQLRSQGLLCKTSSGLYDSWTYEQIWEREDFPSHDESDGKCNGSEGSSSCGKALFVPEAGMPLKPRAVVDFIDDVFNYSSKSVAAKSEIDYLYYRQVEKDRGLIFDDPKAVNSVFDKVYLVSLSHDLEKRLKVGFQLRSLGIDFEWFPAVNGYEGQPLLDYQEYVKRPLGKMAFFSDCADYERIRGSKMIESPGAVGYIYTYISIIEDAKVRGFKNILIVEDDIILCRDFKQRFHRFISSTSEDWKILLLGASQYDWSGVDIPEALKRGFYNPELHKTKGSFAIALNESIFDELIDNLRHLDAPFDNFPVGFLYEKYNGACSVAYPYLVMPDVGDSAIRGGRSQYSHSNRVGWWVPDFNYPAQKPCIGIVLKSYRNLESLECRWDRGSPYNVNYFFINENGISPLHNKEFLPRNYFVESVDNGLYETSSLSLDLLLEVNEHAPFSEEDIHKSVLARFAGAPIGGTFKEVKTSRACRQAGRVSVIIPTYKRSRHLMRAMESVLGQDYEDIELIVVDDNGKGSSFSVESMEVVKECAKRYPDRRIKLIQHEKNANGAAARNTGIFSSSGEYISFLDDDDIYLPGRISRSVLELDGSSESIGAVYCGFLGWNSPSLNLDRFKDGDLTKEIFMLDYFKHYLHTNTATYRASAIMVANGFDESYRRHQDLEFNLRFFERFKIGAVKEALVRLAPEKSTVDNKLYGVDMLNLKRKFLTEFEYLISSFDEEDQRKIYDVHCREISRYTEEDVHIMDIYNFVRGHTINEGVQSKLLAE